jgi:hypothetical protein
MPAVNVWAILIAAYWPEILLPEVPVVYPWSGIVAALRGDATNTRRDRIIISPSNTCKILIVLVLNIFFSFSFTSADSTGQRLAPTVPAITELPIMTIRRRLSMQADP